MAITIPIISEFSDKGITAAQAGFNNLKAKIGEADGAMGKMKAGFGAAGDFIKANAASMATVAGGAIATFAIKAIGDFQDLALEVDKFSNVTSIAAEESSRWIEVAGDLGIETSALEGSINKMNRSLAASRDEYDKLGIEIARTKDGTIDANETFIRTIDAIGKIKDPAARAAAATKLLGKSWSEVSELVEMGAVSLRSALASVSGAKLIDENEIEKAKAFREAQDRLKDAFENFALALAEELLPAVTKILEVLAELANKTSFWGRVTGVVSGVMVGDYTRVYRSLKGTHSVEEAIDDVTMAFWGQQEQMYRTRYEGLKLTEQIDFLNNAYLELKGELDDRAVWRNLQADIERAGELALAAFMEQTPEALRAAEDALDRTRLAAADYIMTLNDVPEKIKTDIIAGLDQASIADIERQLAYLARPRVAGIIVMPGDTPSETRGVAPRSAFSVTSPGTFGITPTSATSGSNVIVNVAGSVVTQNDLVESVRKGLVNAQRNGAGLVYSNS